MASLGVAVLATPHESLAACLTSLYNDADETIVFTCDEEQSKIAAQFGAKVISVQPVGNVGLIRQEMQSALSTDWVLILDPDEVAESSAIQAFRTRIQAAPADVVGFWVPYRMFFMGEELHHSFPSVKQMRLFRRDKVQYTGDLHNVPMPQEGFYDYMADTEAGLEHRFVTNLRDRFERHLLWAQIEAEELNRADEHLSDPMAVLEAGLEEFKFYVVQRQSLRDGCKGLVNALMHSWKRIATLCFLWEIQQAENLSIESVAYWENILSKLEITRP